MVFAFSVAKNREGELAGRVARRDGPLARSTETSDSIVAAKHRSDFAEIHKRRIRLGAD